MTPPDDDSFDLPGFAPKGSSDKKPYKPRSDKPGFGSDKPRYGSDRGGPPSRSNFGSRDGGGPGGDRRGPPRSGGYGSRDGAGSRDGRPSGPPRSGGYGSRDGGGRDAGRDDRRGPPRSNDFKPRYGDKKDFSPRGDSAGGRPPYKPRGEYKPRSDAPRGDYKPRSDSPRGEYKPRSEFKPRGEYKPRTEGSRDGERSGGSGGYDRPRSDRPRSGGYGDFKSGGPKGFDRSSGPRDYKPRTEYSPPPRSFEAEIAPEVSKYLPLKHEKGRYRESRFLIEGAKNISDVVALSPGIIYTVLVAVGFEDEKLKELLTRHKIRTQEVPFKDLAMLCDTEAPQGIIAVANFGALKPDWAMANTVTLLDGIQDPGNVGAILRTSAALGMDAVVLGKGTCDAYNPKVVRASATSLLRVPIETGEDIASKIHFLRLKGFSVVATSPHGTMTLGQAKLRKKVALLFGNEGAGVGLNFMDQADAIVKIPMRGKVESLNVAVAHGLMTYELSQLREKK